MRYQLEKNYLYSVETEGDLEIDACSSVPSVRFDDEHDDLASEADSTESRLGSSRRGSRENLLEPSAVNLSRHSSSNGRFVTYLFCCSGKESTLLACTGRDRGRATETVPFTGTDRGRLSRVAVCREIASLVSIILYFFNLSPS